MLFNTIAIHCIIESIPFHAATICAFQCVTTCNKNKSIASVSNVGGKPSPSDHVLSLTLKSVNKPSSATQTANQ